jgi:hypothetical protein
VREARAPREWGLTEDPSCLIPVANGVRHHVCPEPGCGKAFIQNEVLDRLGDVSGCGGPVANLFP